MLKVGFHTLGCKVNQYETDAMMELFRERDYEIVEFDEIADIYIINTCTVTNVADKKSRKMLSKARKKNPSAVVVAAGCYAQVAQDQLKETMDIDLLIGSTRKNEIVSAVEAYLEKQTPINLVEDLVGMQDFEEMWISNVEDKKRAHIKIQDGCNQFCSYCIIPYTRGRIRSRMPKHILKEVETLVEKGYGEIVLTGIHLASYGVDQEGTSLIELLEMLNGVEGLERIRLGSLEPTLMTVDFINKLFALKKVCPHFHLSLQSGCDETLARMNRKYTTKEFYQSVQNLNKIYDRPSITTDVIVGFPGETEEEFNRTKEFIEKIGFSDIHIFRYSPRKGTKAALMKKQIDADIKHERSNTLEDLRKKLHNNYIEQFIKEETRVIFEDYLEGEEEQFIIGHDPRYLKIIVHGLDQNIIGKSMDLVVEDIYKEFLIGKIKI